MLDVTGPSLRFFRKLERTLFDHSEDEDTGTVLARFDPMVGGVLGGAMTRRARASSARPGPRPR